VNLYYYLKTAYRFSLKALLFLFCLANQIREEIASEIVQFTLFQNNIVYLFSFRYKMENGRLIIKRLLLSCIIVLSFVQALADGSKDLYPLGGFFLDFRALGIGNGAFTYRRQNCFPVSEINTINGELIPIKIKLNFKIEQK